MERPAFCFALFRNVYPLVADGNTNIIPNKWISIWYFIECPNLIVSYFEQNLFFVTFRVYFRRIEGDICIQYVCVMPSSGIFINCSSHLPFVHCIRAQFRRTIENIHSPAPTAAMETITYSANNHKVGKATFAT